jgi:hypothetical protein
MFFAFSVVSQRAFGMPGASSAARPGGFVACRPIALHGLLRAAPRARSCAGAAPPRAPLALPLAQCAAFPCGLARCSRAFARLMRYAHETFGRPTCKHGQYKCRHLTISVSIVRGFDSFRIKVHVPGRDAHDLVEIWISRQANVRPHLQRLRGGRRPFDRRLSARARRALDANRARPIVAILAGDGAGAAC